jgi:hypothetical protein
LVVESNSPVQPGHVVITVVPSDLLMVSPQAIHAFVLSSKNSVAVVQAVHTFVATVPIQSLQVLDVESQV